MSNLPVTVAIRAETALIDATTRFQRRFEVVEDLLAERGKTPQTSSLDEMDSLWNDAKRRLQPIEAEHASNTAQRPAQQK